MGDCTNSIHLGEVQSHKNWTISACASKYRMSSGNNQQIVDFHGRCDNMKIKSNQMNFISSGWSRQFRGTGINVSPER